MNDLLALAGTTAPPPAQADDGIVLAFSINRLLLDRAVSRVMPVVPNSDLQPILKNLQFQLRGHDLRIVGTDAVLSAVVHIPVTQTIPEATTPGSALFPAKRLMQVVRQASADEILVSVRSRKGRASAQVRSGNARWEFPLMTAHGFPDLTPIEQTPLHTVGRQDFLDALSQVRKAASTDVMRPYLMLVDLSEGRLRASDSVRFHQVKFDFPFDCQIPVRAAQEVAARLASIDADEIGVAQTDKALLFRFGLVLLICQKSSAVFPDVDQVMLKTTLSNDQELVVGREDLLQAVRRVRITADEATSAVVLSLNAGSVSVECKDRKGGYAVETIDASWAHPPRHVVFNHQHLSDLLGSVDFEQCSFRLGKDLKTKPTPLVLDDPETGFTGVLSQIRLDWL